MKTEPTPFTRREALRNAFRGAVATAVATPGIVPAAPSASLAPAEPEFVPENDYPFFGGELPEGFETPINPPMIHSAPFHSSP